MTLRLIVHNDGPDERPARLRCGPVEVVVEKGQTKTIEYRGDGEWNVYPGDEVSNL